MSIAVTATVAELVAFVADGNVLSYSNAYVAQFCPRLRCCVPHLARSAAFSARSRPPTSRASRMTMMEITTSSSINVKARGDGDVRIGHLFLRVECHRFGSGAA